MRAFAFACRLDGFTTTMIRVDGPADEWPGLDEASYEIAEHALFVHDGREDVAFESVEAA